jgi:CheY-like chemotaxis protein
MTRGLATAPDRSAAGPGSGRSQGPPPPPDLPRRALPEMDGHISPGLGVNSVSNQQTMAGPCAGRLRSRQGDHRLTSKPRLLVVDDIPDMSRLLATVLRGSYDVSIAQSGPEAIRLAIAGRPDLVLLDIMMPGMDGYEVCRQLKRDPATAGIPVIFVTAMTEIESETTGLALGAVDYITKPFNPGIARLRVGTQIALKQQRDALAARTAELEKALGEIRTLTGLLPVCAWCKRIRDESGRWMDLEPYVESHSQAEFSHGMCPDCRDRVVPDTVE